ncbi:MAG: glycosyltransferase family 87 protein [Thermoguttaceae bacterium]
MESGSDRAAGIPGNAASRVSEAESPCCPTDRTRGKPRPPYDRWERAGRALFVALLLVGLPIAVNRTIHDKGDFAQFYRSGRHVLEHGDTEPHRFLKYYWPSLDVAWAAVACLPLSVGCVLYYALNCGAWIALLAATKRWLLNDLQDLDAPIKRHAVLAAGLLVMPLALDHFCLGAFHILMVWLMVAGLGRAARGRPWSGGLLLGMAVWVKLLPLMGVGYLVLKRKWLAAGVALGSAVAINLVLSAPLFGWQRTWQLHQQWWANQATGAAHRLLDLPEVVDEDRLSDQSLAAVMRRLLTRMAWQHENPERRWVAAGDLSARQLRLTYYAVMALLGLGLLFVCRRPGRATSPGGWSKEIALITLATLWFSPVAWSYHPTAAMPALALTLSCRPKHPWLVWITAGMWFLGMVLLGSQLGRAAGELLWTTLALGAALLWSMRPASTPDPAATDSAVGYALAYSNTRSAGKPPFHFRRPPRDTIRSASTPRVEAGSPEPESSD